MFKAILLALSLSVAYGDVMMMMRGRRPKTVESCDVFLQRKCEENKSLVQYAVDHPGKCAMKECKFKPTRGYTEHPERNHYVQFKPSYYSQKIIYAFKDLEGKACAIPNQMCSCKKASRCKCDSDNVKFCKQKYRTERGFFLVLSKNTAALPTSYSQSPPSQIHKPIPSYPAVPDHYDQPPSPIYYQPHQAEDSNTHSNLHNDQDNNGFYSMARHYAGSSFGDSKPDGSESSSSQSANMNPIFMQMMIQQMMGNKGGAGISFLGGDSTDMGGYMKYQYMMQAMNQHKTPHYDHEHKEKSPGKQKPAKHGSLFNPTMLYYMLMNNKGAKSDGFLKMLPYLMGGGNMFGGRLELKSLWVKVPYGCECEGTEDSESSKHPLWNLLSYFKSPFMQSYGSSMMSNSGSAFSSDAESSMYPGFLGSMSKNPLYIYNMLLSQNKD